MTLVPLLLKFELLGSISYGLKFEWADSIPRKSRWSASFLRNTSQNLTGTSLSIWEGNSMRSDCCGARDVGKQSQSQPEMRRKRAILERWDKCCKLICHRHYILSHDRHGLLVSRLMHFEFLVKGMYFTYLTFHRLSPSSALRPPFLTSNIKICAETKAATLIHKFRYRHFVWDLCFYSLHSWLSYRSAINEEHWVYSNCTAREALTCWTMQPSELLLRYSTENDCVGRAMAFSQEL